MRFCVLGGKAQTYKYHVDNFSQIWRIQIQALYFKKQTKKTGVNPKGLNASILNNSIQHLYTSLFPGTNTSLVFMKKNSKN